MAGTHTLTDPELLLLLRDWDDAAFKEIYQRYHVKLYGFLYKFLKSPELTEDITQDIFIKVWDNRQNLREISAIKSYLFTIGKNQAFKFLKRAGTDRNAKSAILKNYSTAGNSLENVVHARDYQRYLNDLLDCLTPQSREVFRLCRQEGKTYDETAELLGISRNTVKKHMVRTMRVLSDSVERDRGISQSMVLIVLSQMKP